MKTLLTNLILILFVATSSLTAQTTDYVLLDKSTMQIDGTSTIHDWTSEVEEINTTINIEKEALKEETVNTPVKTFTMSIPVKSIESGKGGMNKKTYKALKEDDHPNITFKIDSTEMLNYNSSSSTMDLNVTGELAIAGVNRTISLPVKGAIQDEGIYKFTGNYEINMKDYDIDPPSAVFGTIKSGEKVTVSFELYFSADNPM
ncbi:YceI family protein [Fodinibius halophilus]|uniref:YceI family protein n=1 Tax=Fodinibius halophilus TaxID=1736908 RepID=A0A6M1SZJ3_9BACT|nr:YceI family protein [Fodinibius halophilus]NGP87049.1 YceI family protein [Fodinibius halophilus]